jgi:hypothetical protein
MYRALPLLATCLFLAACETPTTQRYAISPDNNVALRALGATNVGIGPFAGPAAFDAQCRGAGPLKVADGLTHTQYIQRAFEDELKVANAFSVNQPRVAIRGTVNRLEFSSSRAVTGGSWSIDLVLSSTNGKSLSVAEYYEFDSGFMANEACRNTAEAFSRAVQNLVGKAVRSSGFADLTR